MQVMNNEGWKSSVCFLTTTVMWMYFAFKLVLESSSKVLKITVLRRRLFDAISQVLTTCFSRPTRNLLRSKYNGVIRHHSVQFSFFNSFPPILSRILSSAQFKGHWLWVRKEGFFKRLPTLFCFSSAFQSLLSKNYEFERILLRR